MVAERIGENEVIKRTPADARVPTLSHALTFVGTFISRILGNMKEGDVYNVQIGGDPIREFPEIEPDQTYDTDPNHEEVIRSAKIFD